MSHPQDFKEDKDVNIKGILISGFGLSMTIVVGMVLAYASFLALELWEKHNAKPLPPMVEDHVLPPEPRLQAAEAEDLKMMRRQEKKLLGSYGWVDPAHGIVRIPVAQAIEILSRQGLPYKEEKK